MTVCNCCLKEGALPAWQGDSEVQVIRARLKDKPDIAYCKDCLRAFKYVLRHIDEAETTRRLSNGRS